MAHIKLLDPFKKELPLGVPTDLQSPTLFLCFIYYPFPLSPPIPFRDDKLPSHSHRWYPTPEPRHYPYPNDNPRKTLSHRNDGDNACHQPHQRKYIC